MSARPTGTRNFEGLIGDSTAVSISVATDGRVYVRYATASSYWQSPVMDAAACAAQAELWQRAAALAQANHQAAKEAAREAAYIKANPAAVPR